MQVLTLFVSSPGDVRDERQAVGRIVERLQARYWNFIRLEPVLWEKEPLRATAHFNEELIRPSDCDLFVGILWSRLGSPLPSQFNRKDGTRFDSGTEWELEEATEAFEERAKKDPTKAKPDILVYRRISEPPTGDPAQEGARKEQRKKLDAFCERFFFNKDKTIRRAFSPYESVDEFSSLFEQHLEKLLLRHIHFQRGLAEEAVRPLPLEGSPFKGLGAFEFEDAPLFFGRNRPISEALAKLKENHAAGHAFLLIYGGSGYGKSSLMKAGLAPRLMAEGYLPEVGTWCGCGLRPVEGTSPPLETLARALVDALPDLAKLRDTSSSTPSPAPSAKSAKGKRGKKQQQAAKSPVKQAEAVWDSARLMRTLGKPEEIAFGIAAIVAALDRVSAGKPAQLLILVDQLEEIFTAKDVTQEMQDQWFHVLAALAMSRRIWVVATMRSEFFPRVPEHRDLFQLVRHGGGYILSPPELPELHQIIRYPALSAGLQFERHPQNGRDLSEQVYQDAAEAHDALPLLEFTLEELYQRRRDHVLTWTAYEELGGLAGAIAKRAQETYDALPSETRSEAAQRIFGELVTIDTGNEGPATRRRTRRSLLEDAHPGAPGFIGAFVEAKLLVTSEENGAAVVTLAHEALITHWPVLKQWIEDHRDLLLARRRLEDATRLWTDGRKSTRFYLTEGRLAEAERVTSSGVFRLSEDEEDLVRVSRIRARRKLRMFQGATVVFAGLAIGAGALGMVAREKQQQAEVAEDKANNSAAETRRSLAAADFDAGAARVASGASDEALPYLLAALESDPENLDAQALLLGTLRHTAWNFPELTLKHPLPLRALSFGPDRDTLFASTDSSSSGAGFNTTLRWDLEKTAIEGMISPSWGEVTLNLSVAPSGKRLILQRAYKFLEDADLCDAETMRMIARLPVSSAHAIPASCFAWSPDGLLLGFPAKLEEDAAAASPYVWRIIDTTRGKVIRESEPISGGPAPLAAQLDATRLRVVSADGSLVEMPINPAAPVLRGGTTLSTFKAAVFSPDGGQVLATMTREDKDSSPCEVYAVAAKPEEGYIELQSAGYGADDRWTGSTALTERFPWARALSPFWENYAGDARDSTPPLKVVGTRLETRDINGIEQAPRAPVRADAQIESVAFSGNRVAVGSSSGTLEIREVLPRIGYSFPSAEKKEDETTSDNGWVTEDKGRNSDLQHRGHDWRLKDKEGKDVSLEAHPNWMYPMYAVRPADESFVVQGGYSSGSGGYSFSGMVVNDTASGSLTSDLEPVDQISGLIFLGDTHRVAAMGISEVVIADASEKGFRRVATIPVVESLSLHHVESLGALAVATSDEVHLFDEKDFSRIITLPMSVAERWSGWDNDLPQDWAEEPTRGWLAYRREGRLDLWSLKNGRALISGLVVPSPGKPMEFVEKDGAIALSLGDGAILPLARPAGLDPKQLAAVRALAGALAGTGFAEGSRSMMSYSPERRRELAAGIDSGDLEAVVPGAQVLLDRIAALAPRTASPEIWVPLWERLSSQPGAGPKIARSAANLGSENAWYRTYLRGLIAGSDAKLYAWQRGENPVEEDDFDPQNPLPHDDEVVAYHQLAGDPRSAGEASQAAWLLARTDPARLGKELAEGVEDDEFPGLDLKALEQLDADSLKLMREALNEGDMRDWRRVVIDELPGRAKAVTLLDAKVAETQATFEKEPSHGNAIHHAEALALRGQMPEAQAFLQGKIPADAELDLAQAHFLIAARLDTTAPEAIDRALDRLASPWLWKAWLALPGGSLQQRIERAMKAADGHGPTGFAALHAALKSDDAAVISTALSLAKDLPAPIAEYVGARALWASGKHAEVFGIWPDEVPNIQATLDYTDTNGWEAALPWKETHEFMGKLDQQVASLKPDPEASVEQLQELATRLLAPETTATFGIKRVRDAMVHCALQLAYESTADAQVSAMVERARLAGAPNADCLRIEARNFMAAGDFTGGYARWVQLFDTEGKAVISSDYLEAARCVLEDMQPAAAIELLNRGKARYPEDAGFTLDAAWMLLTNGRPEEAGIFLEHGFTIPFPEEQKQMTLAMFVCAAEQTQRVEMADKSFAELFELSPEWGSEESVKGIDWPEELKQSLLSAAKRAAGEPPAAIPVPEEGGLPEAE
ncbi:DUF4062 domain-containing protein [Luteolibacter sp. GHJ8]|uniref:DUF4062 domain-containing protein n=1 Tax=Luteolibacter rhizosphaerae TaxID=2989719 RepID=A0ABT3G1D7_9BACT|nr:DUF4062 domain-containing protein [Luteolibacter rhizosphaerae]MCW1913389.1 DUF4062 domain-containing protein [Luteolibacter rhizosphaerae]